MLSNSRVEVDSSRRIQELEQQVHDLVRVNQEFERIVSELPDGILQFDCNLRCIFMNKAAERATGIPSAALVGRSAFEIEFQDDIKAAGLVALREVLETGDRRTGRYPYWGPSGLRHVEVKYYAHRDPSGSIVNVTVIARDVTDEKVSAAEAEQARAELTQILDSINESFLALSPEWQFSYVNNRVLETTRKRREELIGRNLWEVFPSLLGTPFETEFRRVMSERVPARFQAGFEPNAMWFEVHAYPAKQGIAALVVDITERRKSEHELRSAHQLVHAVIEASPLAIVAMTADGKITMWNPAAERIFGWKQEEVRGGLIPFVPEDKKEEHQAMRVRDLEGEGFIGRELVRRRKDGSPIDISVSTAPIRDESGAITGIISVYEDITERKQTERELSRHADELARSNADLQQFAFVTSHDLQEPLRTMASYAQLLERRYKDKLDGSAHEFLAFIVDGASRMQRLINDLLAFSRLLHGHERALTPVDVDAVVAWALMNLSSAIKESEAVITHDPLPLVTGNEQEIVQLFQNVLSNAIKYRSGEKPAIHIGSDRRDGQHLFWVRDNGVGIDPAYHTHVFGVFKRLHGKDVPGTGIGLALCKRIVEKHGGRIWVESEPGKGATFFFTLQE
ncbi:MAG TPA: PAS domain S-box protein [Bryobacteraceae bacterium]|nr:PAS domain S-box protein [Bryobacteraceae bacterium]